MASSTNVVSRADFATELVPCLSLTSGVGMKAEDQRIWLNAAYKALADVPLDLLQRGCAAAMRTADHPSKIVPAIRAEVDSAMQGIRASERAYRAIFQGTEHDDRKALPAPGGETLTPDEAADICKRFGVGRFSQHAQADRGDAA